MPVDQLAALLNAPVAGPIQTASIANAGATATNSNANAMLGIRTQLNVAKIKMLLERKDEETPPPAALPWQPQSKAAAIHPRPEFWPILIVRRRFCQNFCRRPRLRQNCGRTPQPLNRPTLDDAHRRRRRHDPFELEAGAGEERVVLFRRAFLAAGDDEHVEVEQLADVRLVAGRDDHLA